MTQTKVEVLRSAIHVFNTRGIDAALPFFRDDVVWYPTSQWIEESAYRGHDGLRELSTAFSQNFDGLRYEVHDIREANGRVVACVEMAARIRNSGQPISQPLGLVVSGFHDGTFGEIRVFPSWAEALNAVGLEE